ncbi:hypothetical protein BX600DRAFT_469508 [Xylariales sp. PMI_506]|nr:hypothetical protein BX600DRAFT_469508 [Xylariales sp. PMI_506]
MVHAMMRPDTAASVGPTNLGRHGSRSRTGCSTCRYRKVKCDEVHPICTRCRSGELDCEWAARPKRRPKRERRRHVPAAAASRATTHRTIRPRGFEGGNTVSSAVMLARAAVSHPTPALSISHIALPNSLVLSDQETLYLAYFPQTAFMRGWGKSLKWTPLYHLYNGMMSHSTVLMRAILAVSASEFEQTRSRQLTGLQAIYQAPQKFGVGLYHYKMALRDFQGFFNSPICMSDAKITECFVIFFFMVVYELSSGQGASGAAVHFRGVYSLIMTLGSLSGNHNDPWMDLPLTSQDILLFIMYLNLDTSQPQGYSLSSLWKDAGLGSSCRSVLKQLFYNTRQVNLSIWDTEYPTEEIEDDIAVSRQLEFHNYCKQLKSDLLDITGENNFHDKRRMDILMEELDHAGKQYWDLLAISGRSDARISRRQLQTTRFALAEYYSLYVMCHSLWQFPNPSLGIPGEVAAERAMDIIKAVVEEDRPMVGRVGASMLALAWHLPDQNNRKILQDLLCELFRFNGLYKTLVS